ncbi:MAG: methylthioribulose 1-phosphate dehydratase [Microscillaceae bacterium]|nr:methylthioribulose 1-phosphate dehydratase [Microscillaceae bacterium]MDW8460331.1 methylthioribulose 1-phosphate dehydratase [Cytophagales bacterium]
MLSTYEENYQKNLIELLQIIQLFHQRGWSPATSTNYSFRNPVPHQNTFTISVSGVDKSKFTPHDLMQIDDQGTPLPEYAHLRPSAETLIHIYLYENPENQAVLHTHSLFATILSKIFLPQKGIQLANLEILKAIKGILTHETKIWLPIFENSQNMTQLTQEIKKYYTRNPHCYAFLLSGHGLYAWGSSLSEAKRHIEAIEFLLKCFYYEQTWLNIKNLKN